MQRLFRRTALEPDSPPRPEANANSGEHLAQLLPSMRLWRTLRYPAAPYRRQGSLPRWRGASHHALADTGLRVRYWLLAGALLLALLFSTRFGIGGVLMGILALPAAIVLITLALPLALPLAGVFLGALWATQICAAQAHERNGHTWELLCTAPAGTRGARRALAGNLLRNGQVFGTLQFLHHLSTGIGAAALLLMIGIMLLMTFQTVSPEELQVALRTLLEFLVLLLVLWLNWPQGVALAALAGLYVAAQSRNEAPWQAGALFGVLHAGSLALALLFRLTVQPIIDGLVPVGGLLWMLLPFVWLLLFLALRERLIHWFWRRASI